MVTDRDPPELKSIYGAAAETLNLSAVDYLTIRDLVRCAGTGDIPLHLLLIAMFVSLTEGSVCLKLDPRSLAHKLGPIAGPVDAELYRAVIESPVRHPGLVHRVTAGAPRDADTRGDAYKPLVLVEGAGAQSLYFQKYYSAERDMAESLAAILARPPAPGIDRDAIAAAMAAVLREKPVMVNGAAAVLNREQTLAVLLPLLNNVALISGGPGTGKTFIVLTLLRIMARTGTLPERIRIAAPTGRAAQRLTDSIRGGIESIAGPDHHDRAIARLQGVTIHRLLGYGRSRDDFFYNRYNPIPADLVIVDEASMIDIVLLGRLFQAIGGTARLVLLGDRNQLPSVEAGAVLADLIPDDTGTAPGTTPARTSSPAIPGFESPAPSNDQGAGSGIHAGPMDDRVVILKECYRSEEAITAVARKIIAQDSSVIDDIPELDPRDGFPARGVWRIEPGKGGAPYATDLRRVIGSWATRQYEAVVSEGMTLSELIRSISGTDIAAGSGESSHLLKKIMSALDLGRILTPVRSGLAGASGINDYLQNTLAATLDPAGTGGIYSGAPIIITRNDYARGLFNGDTGIVLLSGDGHHYGVFNRSDGTRLYPLGTLPPHDLSYAITVHKSQGSEYDGVLLILPGTITGSLLTTEILYTGLTRAKHLAVIYASRTTLATTITNRTAREPGTVLYRQAAATA